MEIRIANNEVDSISASKIYALSWKVGYKGIFSDKLLDEIPLDFWVKPFNSNYDTHRFEVAILSVNGEDLGAGGYGLSRDYSDNSYGEITSIYFLEKAWGKGYSENLMNFMVENLKNRECNKFHVWVIKENSRAQRFYEKCGFTKTGKEKQVTFKDESVLDIEYAK